MNKTVRWSLLLLFAGALVVVSVNAGELTEPLREVAAMIQSGRLDEARSAALGWHKVFPGDFDLILMLGQIEFGRRDWHEAARWVRAAAARQPHHPLVKQYTKMLAAIAHRQGSLDVWPTRRESPVEGYEELRRGYFGPTATTESGPRTHPAPPPPLALLDRFGSGTAGLPRPAEGVDWQSLETGLSADQAMKDGLWLKAYLLYTRLYLRDMRNPVYVMGKARAAIKLHRHAEARRLLERRLADNPDDIEAQVLLGGLP